MHPLKVNSGIAARQEPSNFRTSPDLRMLHLLHGT
jgi:hypothetical protein